MTLAILRGWDVRAMVLGSLALGVTEGLASVLLVVTMFAYGHSRGTAGTTAFMLVFAFGQASYFVGGVVAGGLASNRPAAHGALLGVLWVVVFAVIGLALMPFFADKQPSPPEPTFVAVLTFLAEAVLSIALAALGGWLGGKRHRPRAS